MNADPLPTDAAQAAAHEVSSRLLEQAACGGRLRIDSVEVGTGGVIGMCHFPGRHGLDGRGRVWQRVADQDLRAIAEWGAGSVLSLVEAHEFAQYGVPDLGARVAALGMRWLHLPVRDMGVPATLWPPQAGGPLGEAFRLLNEGHRVVIHCAAGLGRTGTLAAALLVAAGSSPAKAIEAVRRARPGTLETAQQEAFVHGLCAVRGPGR